MDWLPLLLGSAVLLPLMSFVMIFVAGPRLGEHGKNAGLLAVLAIFGALVLSLTSLGIWLWHHPPALAAEHAEHATSPAEHATDADESAHAANSDPAWIRLTSNPPHADADAVGHDSPGAISDAPPAVTGDWYTLGKFGQLRLTIGYYIDTLTVAMFCMVSFIALCIHVYATGYMHDELHDMVDHEVTLENGEHLHRPGRYHRFFQFFSLFSFSMLGLVIAGNIAMTFVFWELVGICSYFLIGFYVERPSASTAANKAFIVNRVGDFGMIIGLMALWGSLGTFAFGDIEGQPGIFSLVRPADSDYALTVPSQMAAVASAGVNESTTDSDPPGYGLLVLAGIGIFCGCVGKSAQFPLHVWLPDAMEGPTPVSALVHSATMVAAGVYLVARFFPVFTPEVLLVIAVVGTITLFLAATIALTATDIKRVLAYSTVSQLGYMMMALGVGGWLAGVLHLFTHAFFKSLLFLCSGSVIHAVHTNEMPAMGGLVRKMPWTAFTMLIGCLAIAGAGIPFVIGMSGYYSKDAILEQAFLFAQTNVGFGKLFFVAGAGGAAMTSFYMFRLWFLTFAGAPRDQHRYDHAHESPSSMVGPLIALAVFAIAAAWDPWSAMVGSVLVAVSLVALNVVRGGSKDQADDHHTLEHHAEHGHGHWLRLPLTLCAAVFVLGLVWQYSGYGHVTLSSLLEQARPAGTLAAGTGPWTSLTWPNEHDSHAAAIVTWVTLIAFSTALGGIGLAAVFYWWRILSADDVRRQFSRLYRFLLNKWWFDELYDWVFVKPAHLIANLVAGFDRRWIDGFIDGLASVVRSFSVIWDIIADRTLVDGLVNLFASAMYALGVSLRQLQTGRLRQYVLFIVVGTVAIFVMASFFWGYSFAAPPTR